MDEVKLYENDYEKPALDDEFLEHHGILGMSWGKRNGPPYPLDSDVSTGKRLKESGRERRRKRKLKKQRIKNLKKARKKRAENVEEQKKVQLTKEQILNSKDGKALLKNIDKFTNKEIDDFLTRRQKEQSIAAYVSEYSNKHRSRGERVKSLVRENAGKAISELSKLAVQNGTKMLVKNMAKAAGSGGDNPEKWESTIDQLFREKKK